MKKTLILFLLMLSCSFVGKAQNGFIGGRFTLFFSDELLYETTIHGGYEFNKRFALMAMGGIGATAQGYGDYLLGETGVYARLTAWYNNVFFLDFKPTVEIAFKHSIDVMDIGVVPSLRFRVLPKWEVFTDVGAVGIRYMNNEWIPRIGVNSLMTTVGVNYRF